MKYRNFAFLSSVLCMAVLPFGATLADNVSIIEAPEILGAYEIYESGVPMRQMKLLTVKPVEPDDRAPVWDGTNGNYKQRSFDKTVDWRDGVPIWDDSISSYKEKDFSDWFLEPMDEIFVYGTEDCAQPASSEENVDIMALYKENMAEAEKTRQRVEELLTPKKPSDNLWTNAEPKAEYTAQDLSQAIEQTFVVDTTTTEIIEEDDGCPFETEKECDIWRKKPMVRETVAPRSPKLRDSAMASFIAAAATNNDITADAPEAAPLVARYKMLMKSSSACCTEGLTYSLKQAGASDDLVYKFLVDDANFYGLGNRCLMINDAELDKKYPNTATAVVAADVRNGCLCRGREWFDAMLAPFKEAYTAVPGFAKAKFYYTYTDGLGRKITVSINNDVQNVLNQIKQCP